MAKVQSDVDLLPYNTFKVCVKAKYFMEISSPQDLKDLPKEKTLILGGGSNILLTKDFDGLVVKNNLLGKTVNGDTIEVATGEKWLEFVQWAVDNGWSGLEHLAYIPGTVGGGLVGNMGAYGQQIADIFVCAKAGKEIFTKEQCRFGYRESAFKDILKDYFLESVTLKLSRDPNAKKIAEETTTLRKTKLPDWITLGSAGSFFKNPFIDPEKLKNLQKLLPDVPNFPVQGDHQIKVPAAYLLESLGWKGKRIGNVGTYEKHALIVVNYGGATGKEIFEFAQKMQQDVKEHYGIVLEPEVNVV
ncbi:UDP-N-acetylmuramate dehydrogenase [Patescibacteria group bacterium]|nr:UDP-N-acetylmuramate dehydrogenase [Patescibacteria group bacterium]